MLVIGDGRNNYNPANAWALETSSGRPSGCSGSAPRTGASWGFGDCEMLTYAKQCHQVVVVQSLGDLERVADKLVPV